MSDVRLDIILMGPYGAGKTTLAERLEQLLSWQRLSLDNQQHVYLKERSDYDHIKKEIHEENFTSPILQPYHAYVVERFFQDLEKRSDNCIVEFGYGHSLYQDDKYLDRMRLILDKYQNTFLIIPSPDISEAVGMLLANIMMHPLKKLLLSEEQINHMNEYAVNLYAKYNLAKRSIYTKGKTVEKTCDEICRYARLSA